MQKPIIELNESVLMPIPLALLEEVGIDPFDTIQMYISRGRLIIEPTESDCTMICFGNCRRCPGVDMCEDCCL